jgi:hypothetical protein
MFTSIQHSSSISYIDQYQELPDWPSSQIERNDWEVYQYAIRSSTGETEESLDENFLAYVDCCGIAESGTRKDVLFNYEKWLSGAVHRHS